MDERAKKRLGVVPFAANEYLINLLAWMYLIPRRRGGTRTLKGPAKSRGSSYQRVNPSAGASRRRFLRAAPATTLSSASSYSVSVLAHFRSLAFFSRQAEGNHEGRERRAVTGWRGRRGVATCVANPQTFQLLAHTMAPLTCDIVFHLSKLYFSLRILLSNILYFFYSSKISPICRMFVRLVL